jgi:hypothetical protein
MTLTKDCGDGIRDASGVLGAWGTREAFSSLGDWATPPIEVRASFRAGLRGSPGLRSFVDFLRERFAADDLDEGRWNPLPALVSEASCTLLRWCCSPLLRISHACR